jgi:Carboxypeptidase regulatory-like domain
VKALVIAATLGWFCVAAFGQTGGASITGAVLSPDHKPAPGVAVEAKNDATGIYYKAVSSPEGQYRITQLPAGTYEVSVLNLLLKPFIQKDVVVAAGAPRRVDIQLEAGAALTSLGEVGYLIEINAKRPPPPAGPPPRMADGKPDFSGVWMTRPSDAFLAFSPPVDLQPWAQALVRERVLNQARELPSSRCLPSSDLILGLFPMKYIQTRNLLVQLVWDIPAAHQIFLDGRKHPDNPEPTWRGHSTGKWEGDTLVVDTVGFNDRSWLFFLVPHSEKLHVTQRMRRPDLGHMEIETTYDDPGAFQSPAKFTETNILFPDEEVDEMVCENNQYSEHVGPK